MIRNKKRKTLAVILSVMLMAITASAMTSTVFADEATPTAAGEAAITKVFTMDKSLAVPGLKFTFQFKPIKVNNDNYDSISNNMPIISDKSVTIATTDTGTVTGDTRTIQKQATNFLPGIGTLPATEFTHAGEYEYEVTESEGSTTGVTYSIQVYTMRVYVENTTSGLAIKGITAETLNENFVKVKVDPSATGAGFVFRNSYAKTSGLDIQKTVEGTYGDKQKAFSFSSTLTTPTSNKLISKSIVAEIWSKGSKVTGSTDVSFDFDANGEATATYSLKHDQYLHFPATLPVGTTYTVTETGTQDYTPSARITYNSAAIPQEVPEGTSGDDYTVDDTNSSDTTIVGEGTNKAVMINTFKTVSPTGILIDNLPYILMVLIPVLAVIIYVIRRKKIQDSAADVK